LIHSTSAFFLSLFISRGSLEEMERYFKEKTLKKNLLSTEKKLSTNASISIPNFQNHDHLIDHQYINQY
jgi:hypothetical protein